MKHLSLWLTVLALGAMPLAAAALDYGPNRSLLAADANGALPLPGAQARAAASGNMPDPDASASETGETGGSTAEGTALARQSTTPGPSPSRRHGSTMSSPHQPPPASKPGLAPTQPAWQSLLPGSIQ